MSRAVQAKPATVKANWRIMVWESFGSSADQAMGMTGTAVPTAIAAKKIAPTNETTMR
jgi:hypothetical protein